MSNQMNSKELNNATTNHSGLAERNITADDRKKYKNALDTTSNYVSGDKEWSSSSHQFGKDPAGEK